MENSNPTDQEVVGEQLIEDISQLQQVALGEGAAACEACGEKLREGAPLVAFAFRPADQPTFQFGHAKCTECRHEPAEYFTLGVRELVLDGRVGTYPFEIDLLLADRGFYNERELAIRDYFQIIPQLLCGFESCSIRLRRVISGHQLSTVSG